MRNKQRFGGIKLFLNEMFADANGRRKKEGKKQKVSIIQLYIRGFLYYDDHDSEMHCKDKRLET